MPIPFRPTPLQNAPPMPASELMQSLIQSKQRRILKAERERAEARQAELDKHRLEQQAFENQQAIAQAERLKEAAARQAEEHKLNMLKAKEEAGQRKYALE